MRYLMPQMVILFFPPILVSTILFPLKVKHRWEVVFLAWFKKHAAPERFTIRTASAIVEGKGFYAAIIVENRNPLLETIIADFESTALALTEGKP